MKSDRYDVVIIGAGPAGSLCARDLARLGYKVLLAEKRPVVGVPVRCGEATGTRKRLSDFTVINEDYIETDLEGAIIHGPLNVTVRYDKPGIGLMLDRRLFDQDLAKQASEAGAELMLQARVADVEAVRDNARGVKIVVGEKQEMRVEASMVVGADGAEALSGRWVGLKTRQLPPYTCTAIEFRLKAEAEHPGHLEFWQGHESLNRGYVWIFPKKKSGVVNLGAGIITPKMGEKNMHDLTMEWKEKHFPKAHIEEIHGGAVPVSGNLEESVDERFLLVGDAAHHTNPMTGGGIGAALCAADFGAKWIHRAFVRGDFSKSFLRGYHQDCWNRFGRNHHREMRIRDFVLGLSVQDQARFYRIFKAMVDGGLGPRAKLFGYMRLLGLAASNFTLFKKAWLN